MYSEVPNKRGLIKGEGGTIISGVQKKTHRTLKKDCEKTIYQILLKFDI